MRRKDAYDRDSLHFAPFVLFPSPFPKAEFDRSLELQPILNELMHKVAHDRKFLTETLRSTIQVDEFTRKLFEIYETVQNEGVAQVRILFYCYYSFVSISIFRNFYFQTILCANVV